MTPQVGEGVISRHDAVQVGTPRIFEQHTWGSALVYHPHIHYLVPAGGLSQDGKRWIHGPERFLLPVKILSEVFRGKFVDFLRQAWRTRKLVLDGPLEQLRHPVLFEDLIQQLYRHDWVVYSKAPFSGPEKVLEYLARYTHRVAISNQRLLSIDDHEVVFRYKDYARDGAQRTMGLEPTEFIRRFLQHVLPSRFVRIRWQVMKNQFRRMMEEVELKYDSLIASEAFPFSMPASHLAKMRGVYIASENGAPLYVGRANDLRARLRNHLYRSHNTATFAFLLARHDTGLLKATYTTKGSRADLLKNNPEFLAAFDRARERIRTMKVKIVEEDEPTKQALLEIYAATVSGAKYNNFDNH